jgi:hypothetical protein
MTKKKIWLSASCEERKMKYLDDQPMENVWNGRKPGLRKSSGVILKTKEKKKTERKRRGRRKYVAK